MMRLLLFGPPGVGKGTQAKLLSAEFNVPHISTGDLLRTAVTEGTPLGKKAKAVMDAGQLVSDDIMIGIVREALASSKTSRGFILDGFPRTLAQASALSTLLEELHINDYRVITFQVDEEEVTTRLSHRLTCRKDGKIFSLDTDGVTLETPCPTCGGELYQRDDDKEETVRKRILVYDKSTSPVIEYYKQRGLAIAVDGMATIEEVNASIKKALAEC